ncbi:MAG TPA: PQQ-binding-like beta-propeller repeat protein [Nocardioidaceae bacterium]|nr:PQQ-binding-like beta-propeller repeat protein [Nocardioidaceae bacterium]
MVTRSVKAFIAVAALVAASTVSGQLLVQQAAGARRAAADPVGTDWPAYERNAAHSSAIFGDPAITTANAGSLHRAWSFVADAATMTGQPARSFDASPTVVGGRVYIGSRTGMFYALNATTGGLVWKRQLDFGSAANCVAKGIVGTATVTTDPTTGTLTVYAAGSHFVYALNANTGAQQWKRSIGPNTAAGVAAYFNWGSPTVDSGHVFEGIGASCDSQKVRGGVVEINQHTGAVQHTWYDAPKGKKGATVWSSQAADGTSVWVTTGSPDETGTAIYDAYSIIRLNESTMAKTGQWTAPNTLTSDLDFGSSPTLFSATLSGVSTPMIGACNKNGNFYALRQSALSAGPVWSRAVGQTGGTGTGACITSAAWDFQLKRLFVASNTSTIAGQQVPGALRALNPSTGAVIWERPLPCLPNGSPTINGTVVAVPMYSCPTGVTPTVQLFRESDGQPLGSVPATGKTFAQPVFASGALFVASEDGTLTAYRP